MCISLSSIKISFVLNLLLGIVVLRTSKGWWQTKYGPAFKNFEYPWCIQWSTLVSAVLTMYVDEEVWLGQFMVIIKCLVWGWYASGFRSESFAVWNSYGSDF